MTLTFYLLNNALLNLIHLFYTCSTMTEHGFETSCFKFITLRVSAGCLWPVMPTKSVGAVPWRPWEWWTANVSPWQWWLATWTWLLLGIDIIHRWWVSPSVSTPTDGERWAMRCHHGSPWYPWWCIMVDLNNSILHSDSFIIVPSWSCRCLAFLAFLRILL